MLARTEGAVADTNNEGRKVDVTPSLDVPTLSVGCNYTTTVASEFTFLQQKTQIAEERRHVNYNSLICRC